MQVMNIRSLTDLRTDSQNWDFPNRKQEWQTAVGISACSLVHSSAQVSVNNRNEQFTSYSFINAISYVETKKTVSVYSQNLLNCYCLFLCYQLQLFQIKFWKKEP
jgi:hypothetical protein